jgi:hypothetical protein
MSTKKPSKPTPCYQCPECGRLVSDKDRLCLQCSRPVTNAEYMARRYEGLDRGTPAYGSLPPQHYFRPTSTARSQGGQLKGPPHQKQTKNNGDKT